MNHIINSVYLSNNSWGAFVGVMSIIWVVFVIAREIFKSISSNIDYKKGLEERREQEKLALEREKELAKLYEVRKHKKEIKRKEQGIEAPTTYNNTFPILNLVETRYVGLAEIIYGSKAKIGNSEKFFYEFLIKYFGKEKIFWNSREIHGKRPDFIYEDITNEINIVIEIDEPYIYESGEPIHFIDNEKDIIKNDVYTDAGWTTVRFSEFQVITYPIECSKFLGEVVDYFNANCAYKNSNHFKNVKSLPEDECWSNDDATYMFEKNYRENYSDKSLISLEEFPQPGKYVCIIRSVIEEDDSKNCSNLTWLDPIPKIKIELRHGLRGKFILWFNMVDYKTKSDFPDGKAPYGHEFRSSINPNGNSKNENYLVNLQSKERVKCEDRINKVVREFTDFANDCGIEPEAEFTFEDLEGLDVGVSFISNSDGEVIIHSTFRSN